MNNATSYIQQKRQEFILLLQTYPDGLTSEQIRTMLDISGCVFQQIVRNIIDYPIGHDSRISNKYYWVGL
ncbi:MAG: hypothetical protein ACTTH8_05785 [Treponema sp.]